MVVTADHGVSFRKGQYDRRNVNEKNIDEISPVPLFIKAPGQTKPKVNTEVVETVDVLPTIADILHFKLPARPTASRRSRTGPRPHPVKMLKRNLSGWIRIPEAAFAAPKQARSTSASRSSAPAPTAPTASTGSARTRSCSVGRGAARVGYRPRQGVARRYRRVQNVDLKSPTIPIWVTGRIKGGPGPPRDLAVAVREDPGASAAAPDGQPPGEVFGMLVPPTASSRGKNSVVLYAVEGGRLKPPFASYCSFRQTRDRSRACRRPRDEEQRGADLLGTFAVALELVALGLERGLEEVDLRTGLAVHLDGLLAGRHRVDALRLEAAEGRRALVAAAAVGAAAAARWSVGARSAWPTGC